MLDIFKKITIPNLKNTAVEALKMMLGELGYVVDRDYWIDVINVNSKDLYDVTLKFSNIKIRNTMVQKIKELLSLKETRQMLNELRGFRNLPEIEKFVELVNEYLPDDELDDALDSFSSTLSKLGYKIMGQGGQGLVFQPPSRKYVIKIYVDDAGYDAALKIMKANSSDPHMPKIKWGPLVIRAQHSIKMVVMEKLSILLGSNYEFAYSLCAGCQFENYDADLEIFNKRINIKCHKKGKSDAQRLLILSDGLKFFNDLWPSIHKFAATGRDFDLGTENLMQRADGTVVIIDPLT